VAQFARVFGFGFTFPPILNTPIVWSQIAYGNPNPLVSSEGVQE